MCAARASQEITAVVFKLNVLVGETEITNN